MGGGKLIRTANIEQQWRYAPFDLLNMIPGKDLLDLREQVGNQVFVALSFNAALHGEAIDLLKKSGLSSSDIIGRESLKTINLKSVWKQISAAIDVKQRLNVYGLYELDFMHCLIHTISISRIKKTIIV